MKTRGPIAAAMPASPGTARIVPTISNRVYPSVSESPMRASSVAMSDGSTTVRAPVCSADQAPAGSVSTWPTSG